MNTHITDIVNIFNWESLEDVCLVAHSYGGAPASGALDRIGDRVSSIVWLDAFKLNNGQAVLDVTSDALRRRILDAADKGELSFPPPPKTSVTVVNENDRVRTYIPGLQYSLHRLRFARPVDLEWKNVSF